MPRIDLMSAIGVGYSITTRNPDLLKQWFDEVLPHAYIKGRTQYGDNEYYWPRVNIWPMWAWGTSGEDPDWVTDSRVLGRLYEFEARDGETGITRLQLLRNQLEAEIKSLPDSRRPPRRE